MKTNERQKFMSPSQQLKNKWTDKKEGILLKVKCQLPTHKGGKSFKVGKSTFYNHYRKDWVRQKLSIGAKSRREF